ncbi:MarR family winged helix-turn-helix transcriptional regulator [Streptomyces sp. NPDC097640]|uniref:MarR family winged helix-turn-helix transcriptional regulator n=1 Tax=Streptomyces sp. NPDC097640 TaxID=3157229 RepID=UPI00331F51DC
MTEHTDRNDAERRLQAALDIDMYQQPGHLIRRAQQVHTHLWTSSVSTEITSTQFAVLSVIAERPGSDQNTISRRVSLDTSTVAEVVYRLTERGYLTRVKDPADRRRNLHSLSPEGERVFTEVSRSAADMTDRMTAVLSEHDRDELVRILQNLVEAGERLREENPGGEK